MLEYTPLLIVGVVCLVYGAYNMGFAKGHIKGFIEGLVVCGVKWEVTDKETK